MLRLSLFSTNILSMSKTKKIILIALAVLAAALVTVFFSFGLVVYVTPSSLSEIEGRWSHPGFLNPGYFCIERTDDSLSLLERIKGADTYIYAPYSLLDDGTRCTFYTVVKDGEKVDLGFSEEEMYSSFLSSFSDKLTALVYEEESRYAGIFSSLCDDHAALGCITYTSRVSVVNEEKLTASADTYWAVIITDPLSSSLLYRGTKARVVMDERDAVSAVSLDTVISLHYDWARMIASDFTPYYTYSVLHK